MRTLLYFIGFFFCFFAVKAHAEVEIIANVTHVTCFGKSTGAIDIQMRNGVPPYTFKWHPDGQTTEDLVNIPAGDYIVQVKDANEMIGFKEIEVKQPSPLMVEIDVLKSTLCPEETTTMIASVSGGVAPYSYKWNDPAKSKIARVEDISAGDYMVTVTDENACRTEKTIKINASDPRINLVQKSDESCMNAKDGSISVSASGGKSPYTFLWSNNTTGSQISDLAPDQYDVTLTDQADCNITASYQINASNHQLLPGIDFNFKFTPISCYNYSDASFFVSLEDTSALNDLTIRWMDPSGKTGYVKNDVVIENLAAGEYHVTITDNKCVLNESFTIPQPSKVEVDYYVLEDDDEETVDIVLFASGGNGTYTYSKDGGKNFVENNHFYDIIPGNSYEFVVKDGKNCTSEEINFKIDESMTNIDAITENRFEESPLQTYPNPSFGTFMIDFRNQFKEDVRIHVVSMLGQVVVDQLITSRVDHIWFEVDLTNQAGGIYLLTVETETKTYKERVIIQ